jgi:uncharacterized protein YcaQ
MGSIEPRLITKENARRFLVLRQNLLREKEGKEGTLEAIRHLGCIQTDPISVVHRNHHLVLHNRVKDYDISYLDELLYKDRLVFEYWCNEKSLVPIEDFRYFKYRMENPTLFHSPYYEHIKEKRAELNDPIRYVRSEIRKSGPVSARELEDKGRLKSKIATDVLNLLWDCGELMIHHVEGNRRYYDLAEHVLPSTKEMEVLTRKQYERFMIQKYMDAYGLVDSRDWRFGWLPLKILQRKALIKQMVQNNELCPVKVEGVKQEFYILRELLHLLDNRDTSMDERIYFMAPLDNLLWNRKVISELFDFDYSWEVYKVPEKRIYGYYVMPVLCGTRFIGRLDPKLDRQDSKMTINSLTIVGKSVDKSSINELALSLRRFLEFHNVSHVVIHRTQPEELKGILARELDCV